MGVNLQLLGIQAIPRLIEKLGVEVKFPDERMLYGAPPSRFQEVYKKSGEILNRLFREFGLSWWDVYINSDIGMERFALAEEMWLRKGDLVLDIGCGRGYFTIAAAKFSRFVVGLDLMNGFWRQGWWRNFRISMQELNLQNTVLGVRSDSKKIPFKDDSFTLVAAVHSIRNFPDRQSIQKALNEMKRVVSEGGNVIIVESLPVA